MEARRPIARLYKGEVGWFRVENRPAVTQPTQPGSAQEARRLYDGRFALAPLEKQTVCPEVTGTGPVLILVHGIGGDGHEWIPVLPVLDRLGPSQQYMYRWFFPKERKELVDGLVRGIEQLARCNPSRRVLVLAHSAGGVLCSFAASLIRVPPSGKVEIITVASPLAGSGTRSTLPVEDEETRFLLSLGGVIPGYPAAAPGVEVVHMRTRYPADEAMKPSSSGHQPNAPGAVVEGARTVELPDSVDHVTSLLFVATQLVERERL